MNRMAFSGIIRGLLTSPTLRSLVDLARQSKYDGPVTVHFRGGVPVTFEIPAPSQWSLAPEGQKIGPGSYPPCKGLDNPVASPP